MAFQLLGEILFLFAKNYLFFVVIQIMAGLGFAFQSGCIQALVYDFLKERKRESEMKKIWGSINSLGQAGFIVGALASSFIVSYPSQSRIILAILFTIISVTIGFVISLFLQEPTNKYHHSEKSPIKMFKELISIVRNNPLLRRVILFGLFTTPFLAYLNTFQPPYFELSKTPLSWLGFTRAFAGVIAIIFLQYAYKLEHRFKENGILIMVDPFVKTIKRLALDYKY
jgi:MFS family permease